MYVLQCPCFWPLHQCWSYRCPIHLPLDIHVHFSTAQHSRHSLLLLPPAMYSVGDFRIRFSILRQRRTRRDFPDMLKNIGPGAVRWLHTFYDDVTTTANKHIVECTVGFACAVFMIIIKKMLKMKQLGTIILFGDAGVYSNYRGKKAYIAHLESTGADKTKSDN